MQLIIHSWFCLFSTSNTKEHRMPIAQLFFCLIVSLSGCVYINGSFSRLVWLPYLAVSRDPYNVFSARRQITHLRKRPWRVPVRSSPVWSLSWAQFCGPHGKPQTRSVVFCESWKGSGAAPVVGLRLCLRQLELLLVPATGTNWESESFCV